jgi:hypothetical protein
MGQLLVMLIVPRPWEWSPTSLFDVSGKATRMLRVNQLGDATPPLQGQRKGRAPMHRYFAPFSILPEIAFTQVKGGR